MLKFSANLTMMFNEVDFLDRFERASGAGFKGVEFLFPYAWDKEKLAEKLENSVVKGPQIQSLDSDATPETTIIQIRGPKSGAQSTAVQILGDGKFIVEGKTYEETYQAADFVSVTLLKMLCGSPDCPDAAACATGGDCGC